MQPFFFAPPLFMLIPLLLVMLSLIFWVWMLVDCLANEPPMGNDKLIWALLIFFVPTLGALLYLLVRRPQRIAEHGR